MELWFKLLLIYLIVINVTTLITYGVDKRKAIKDKWRIQEKTLLILAVIGGSVGAFAGMHLFHHKTNKWKFSIGVPLIFLLQTALVVFLCLRF